MSLLASGIRAAQIKAQTVSTANGDCISVEDSTTDNHAKGSCCGELCRLGESETDTCRTSDRLTQLMSSATFTAQSLLFKGDPVSLRPGDHGVRSISGPKIKAFAASVQAKSL